MGIPRHPAPGPGCPSAAPRLWAAGLSTRTSAGAGLRSRAAQRAALTTRHHPAAGTAPAGPTGPPGGFFLLARVEQGHFAPRAPALDLGMEVRRGFGVFCKQKTGRRRGRVGGGGPAACSSCTVPQPASPNLHATAAPVGPINRGSPGRQASPSRADWARTAPRRATGAGG